MAVFIVIPTTPKAEIKPSLKTSIAESNLPSYPLINGETLIAFKGTSKELSDLLKISDGTNGPAIVSLIGSYYGRSATDIWEWIAVHGE
jgi:predicted heme/steroid binding protein